MRLVEETNRLPPPHHPADQPYHPYPPKAVSCVGGVGRTGTFLAASSLLRARGLLLHKPVPKDLPESELPPSRLGPVSEEIRDDDLVTEIDSLIEQRPGMLETFKQMESVYEFMRDLYDAQLQQQGQDDEEAP